jgi:hypothetical protein
VIATVPAAPPSKLSKKLIELHIPTIHITVITASKAVIPVGFPILSFHIKITATTTPAILCPINLGRGFRLFKSSHNPTKPITIAGPRTDVASQKLLQVNLFEINAI